MLLCEDSPLEKDSVSVLTKKRRAEFSSLKEDKVLFKGKGGEGNRSLNLIFLFLITSEAVPLSGQASPLCARSWVLHSQAFQEAFVVRVCSQTLSPQCKDGLPIRLCMRGTRGGLQWVAVWADAVYNANEDHPCALKAWRVGC